MPAMNVLSFLPMDHPAMLEQRRTNSQVMKNRACPWRLQRGAPRSLSSSLPCNAYRETRVGIMCGMDFLGEIRTCKRNDV